MLLNSILGTGVYTAFPERGGYLFALKSILHV